MVKRSGPNSDSVKLAIFPERIKKRAPSGRAGRWHPDRGAFFVARWSEGRSPDDPWFPMVCLSPDPARVSHWLPNRKVRHPIGVVYSKIGPRFPGSSALRASTTGLKSDDPSGALPLRDRQAGRLTGLSGGADLLGGSQVSPAPSDWSDSSDMTARQVSPAPSDSSDMTARRAARGTPEGCTVFSPVVGGA